MTLATDKREITKLVQIVLSENGVDNLKCELDLVQAFHNYALARNDGETPANARKKIVISGALGWIGISDEVREKARMKQLIEDTLRLNIDEEEWNDIIIFCLARETNGETIKQYQAWRENDKYNSPKDTQLILKPELIKATWRLAFNKNDAQPKHSEGKAFYG